MRNKDLIRTQRITEAESTAIFNELAKEGEGLVPVQRVKDLLSTNGISSEDPRLNGSLSLYSRLQKEPETMLNQSGFKQLLKHSDLVKRAFRKELVIPNFADFRNDVKEIFRKVEGNTGGEIDESLPHPDTGGDPAYAVSVCTIDGQLLQLGNHDLSFSIQSISKAVNYAIAREEVGRQKLHEHVGVEPGGENFDVGMVLNEDNLPHNPLINSGAMMTANFIKPEMGMDDRLQHVMQVWEDMMGKKEVEYKKESFEAERKGADKNFALAHLMKERGAFPEDTDLETVVSFYLKCCAIEVNIDDLAHAAATLANFGSCPSTGKKVFKHDTVRDTLSMMLSSGMYDHSGEFAFRVGLPAKSGIAGGIMIVVPELMGIAVYSPPLDSHGNSVRGVAFCEALVDRFNLHKYDAHYSWEHGKKDPRKRGD